MKRNVIEGNLKKVEGKVKQRWGKPNNDQRHMVFVTRDQLIGSIQECYGIARDEAERQVTDWEAQYGEMFDEVALRTWKNANAALH